MAKKDTKKTEKKGNFRKKGLPVIVGIGTMLIILALLNSQFIVSKFINVNYKPVDATPLNEETSSQDIDPSAPPKIIINSLEVTAPIDFNQQSVDETNFQLSLRNGVVHYPFTAKPGEAGNVVIFGHSSGQVWAPGDYKFIFSKLEHLTDEDIIFIEYQGTRYEYKVTDANIVPPTDVSVLRPTNDNTLTLITCYPVGSNAKRLIISAKQINPNPDKNKNKKQNEQVINQPTGDLPGDSKSTWQTIKSIFGFN